MPNKKHQNASLQQITQTKTATANPSSQHKQTISKEVKENTIMQSTSKRFKQTNQAKQN